MTEETNEPYTSLERFAWPVVILVVVIGIAAIVHLILGVL